MSVANLILPGGQRACTGRVKPKARPRTLHLGNYIDPTAAAAMPTSVDYATPALASIKRFFMNDREGCCVISDVGHALGVWSAMGLGAPILPSDAEIHAAYQRLKVGWGDSGCVITDVLDAWTSSGITLGGKVHKIAGYVAVDWRSKPLVQAAVLMFGGVRLGFDLPEAWYNTRADQTWDATRSRIIGGHDVRIVKYDDSAVYIATWGRLNPIPWDVLTSAPQIDEAYCELSPDWFNAAGLSPTGLDAAALKADLDKLGNGTLPPIVAQADPFDFGNWA